MVESPTDECLVTFLRFREKFLAEKSPDNAIKGTI